MCNSPQNEKTPPEGRVSSESVGFDGLPKQGTQVLSPQVYQSVKSPTDFKQLATACDCLKLPHSGGGLGFKPIGADGKSESGLPRVWRQNIDDKSDRVLVPLDWLRRAKQLLIPATAGIMELCLKP